MTAGRSELWPSRATTLLSSEGEPLARAAPSVARGGPPPDARTSADRLAPARWPVLRTRAGGSVVARRAAQPASSSAATANALARSRGPPDRAPAERERPGGRPVVLLWSSNQLPLRDGAASYERIAGRIANPCFGGGVVVRPTGPDCGCWGLVQLLRERPFVSAAFISARPFRALDCTPSTSIPPVLAGWGQSLKWGISARAARCFWLPESGAHDGRTRQPHRV